MKNKKLLLFVMALLVLVGAGSYAYFEGVVHGTGNTNMEGSAHTATIQDLILTGTTEVVNSNMIPGESSTYSFTIQNPNGFQVCFGIYLDNVVNTFVNTEDLEVSMNDETGLFPSTGDTSTIIGGFRAPANATTTYTLTVTYKDVVGKNQTGDIGKSFSGTIKARTTECGPGPSDRTLAALASLNSDYVVSNSDKCLHVDSNGMITDYSATMDDSDTPIVCAMEDDYGTSYYLRGLHTDNYVKFANSCWKIIRVTGTGGIKMVYNGDVNSDDNCVTVSAVHLGIEGTALSLSGNKLYGTSYTKEGSTYTLTDTSTLNWPNDSSSIIGKYTCGNTSNTCTTLYAVTGEYNSTQAYSIKLNQSTNYAQIGQSSFYSDINSPAYVGYVFNDAYTYKEKTIVTAGRTIIKSSKENTSNYYYGNAISYNSTDGYYYIKNQDGSNVVQLDWASNYETNLVGKYTCESTSKYNSKTIRCKTAYIVLDTTTTPDYMIAEVLSGERLSIGDIKLATSYTYDGTNYILTSPVTISVMDWYNGYSSYNNYYYCEDWNQTTCTVLYKIVNASQKRLGSIVNVANNYYYGSSFTYNENNARPYTLTDTVQFFDIIDSTNNTSLNTHHYTCFNISDNTCDELYFIYHLNGSTVYYIKLNGNETISDALDKMLSSDSPTAKNSHIKGVIDYWYKENILGTNYESYLEDTVFCNDRTIDSYGGWSETGSLNNYLYFNGGKSKYYLKCPNKRDAFTVNDTENGNGALTNAIALLSVSEALLYGNNNSISSASLYWLLNPSRFESFAAYNSFYQSFFSDNMLVSNVGIRPSISLKPGTTFESGGDGSKYNPFVVQ